MVKATVQAGVCGFKTSILAASEDRQHVNFHIESDCEKIRRLAAALPAVDGFQEISLGFDGAILQRVRQSLNGCCAGCIVPGGLFKTMQAAAGLALPVDASIQFQREEASP